MHSLIKNTHDCCSTTVWMRRAIAGLAIGSIAAIAFWLGRSSQPAQPTGLPLPLIDAVASASAEGYSIATGQVSERAEGLYVLDHNSGLLQCHVIYPRMQQFMATFQVNVAQALGTAGKGGNYVMVTGNAAFQGPGNQAYAPSVLYVLDSSTGNYAAFAIPFDRVAMNARRPQQGVLVPIAKGVASAIPDRDALR